MSGREADVKALPVSWAILLEQLLAQVPEHAQAVRAIFKRLAVRAAGRGLAPTEMDEAFMDEFIIYEKATKSDSHVEKLRSAGKIWDRVTTDIGISVVGFTVANQQCRLGNHHAKMLQKFQDEAVLTRWFTAPRVLWQQAERWSGRRIGLKDGSHDLSASRSDAGADFLDLRSSEVRRSIRWLFINSSANSPSLVRNASIRA